MWSGESFLEQSPLIRTLSFTKLSSGTALQERPHLSSRWERVLFELKKKEGNEIPCLQNLVSFNTVVTCLIADTCSYGHLF